MSITLNSRLTLSPHAVALEPPNEPEGIISKACATQNFLESSGLAFDRPAERSSPRSTKGFRDMLLATPLFHLTLY
jgi:hypothetical protein